MVLWCFMQQLELSNALDPFMCCSKARFRWHGGVFFLYTIRFELFHCSFALLRIYYPWDCIITSEVFKSCPLAVIDCTDLGGGDAPSLEEAGLVERTTGRLWRAQIVRPGPKVQTAAHDLPGSFFHSKSYIVKRHMSAEVPGSGLKFVTALNSTSGPPFFLHFLIYFTSFEFLAFWDLQFMFEHSGRSYLTKDNDVLLASQLEDVWGKHLNQPFPREFLIIQPSSLMFHYPARAAVHTCTWGTVWTN